MTAGGKPLVVRLRNWIGDVVLGIPALELLQSHGYALQLVARGPWAPSLLAAYGWPVHVQPAALGARVQQLRAIRRACAAQDAGFEQRDNALVFPASLSSALDMRLAGLRAVGWRNEGRSPLLARSMVMPSSGHELARYWSLACRFLDIAVPPPPAIGLRWTPAAEQRAVEALRAATVQGAYIVVCPFAGGVAATPGRHDKKWPGFVEFVARATPKTGLPIVIQPGPGDEADARRLFPTARVVPSGCLGSYAALLAKSALVVANDTGPGHIAAAAGSRLISILGAAPVERWAPVGPQVTILQQPLVDDAVVWPSVDAVLESARVALL